MGQSWAKCTANSHKYDRFDYKDQSRTGSKEKRFGKRVPNVLQMLHVFDMLLV